MSIEIKNADLGKGKNAQQQAQERLNATFKQIVLTIVDGFIKLEKAAPAIKSFYAHGGGATWLDIKKAIEDDSDIGKEWLEVFRVMAEAELISRGVLSPQVEKKPVV